MATGVDLSPPVGCVGYCPLEYDAECCDCFRGQLRTIMALWWLHGLVEDHKGGFCDHSVRHRLQSVL